MIDNSGIHYDNSGIHKIMLFTETHTNTITKYVKIIG